MQDIFFVSKCDHRVNNYELTITKEFGKYVATFPAPIVNAKNRIFIRSWEDEQQYIERFSNYTNIQAPIKNKSISAPISGANASIGILNYEFIAPDKIAFTDPIPGRPTINTDANIIPAPKYLADFIFVPDTCPRCSGTGIVKDINISDSGNVVYVTEGNKIKQRILKALMTPLGTSPYDATFGSEINNLIGQPITENLRIILQKTIVNAVQNLIDNQDASLDSKERINAIQGITLDTPDADKTTLYVKVLVSSTAGELIDCSIGFNLEN